MFLYWANFSINLRNRNELFTAIFNYISCVNDTDNQNRNCEDLRQKIYDVYFPILTIISVLMTSMVNLCNVVFVLQFREVKKRLTTLRRRFTSKSNIDGASDIERSYPHKTTSI